VRKRLPVLNWLPHYRPSTAVADLVAGVTVGLTLIPQAIAYASLAGLHPQVRIRGKKTTNPLYVPVTVHRERSVKEEYQQEATKYDLLSIPDVDY